jgi:hypothetical protein
VGLNRSPSPPCTYFPFNKTALPTVHFFVFDYSKLTKQRGKLNIESCSCVLLYLDNVMLDENLPTFFIKPSSDNKLHSTIFLGQGGHDLKPEYTLRRPDPSLPASKNCYAVALYDSYNPEVLYAEVLVQPEWTQPTLSQTEIRANNGISPPPVPVVPNSFAIQLYNPDQQVKVKQIAGSWNSSAYWEFEMPQNTFRIPSVSALDRSQSDPAASDVTPKVAFKWKRDSKLSKDITCVLAGKSTDGKKSKEPDITVAMFQHGKELTVYEPNMHRVEVEDSKGLEVVLLLSAAVIKDVFFNASRELFNISSPPTSRKNSGGLAMANGRTNTISPVASGALPVPSSQIPPPQPPRHNAPTQAEIDSETARLLAIAEAEEKERERAERREEKRIKKMLEAEEKERQRREAEVTKETERLRRQYGVNPVPDNFTPPMPPRPNANYQPQQFPQYLSAPHSQPSPIQRPSSVPAPDPAAQSGPFNCSTLNSWWGGPSAAAPAQPPPNSRHRQTASGPYLQAPAQGSASSSGFFGGGHWERDDRRRLLGMPVAGEGERKKITKKRSVYF